MSLGLCCGPVQWYPVGCVDLCKPCYSTLVYSGVFGVGRSPRPGIAWQNIAAARNRTASHWVRNRTRCRSSAYETSLGCEHIRHCRDVGAASYLLKCVHLRREVCDRMKSFRLRRVARRPACVRSAVASSQTVSDHLQPSYSSYVPAVLVGRRRRDSPSIRPGVTAPSARRTDDGPGGRLAAVRYEYGFE